MVYYGGLSLVIMTETQLIGYATRGVKTAGACRLGDAHDRVGKLRIYA